MHPIDFIAVIILGQLCVCAFGSNQSCQLLINESRIDDPVAVDVVQDACQSSGNISRTERARKACELSHHVFQNGRPGVDQPTEYIGPRSRFYNNRTTSNWFVEHP